MLRIIVDEVDCPIVHVSNVPPLAPVFAKKEGKLCGMVVKEEEGWILRIGRSRATNGHHVTLEEVIRTNRRYGYDFFVEEF